MFQKHPYTMVIVAVAIVILLVWLVRIYVRPIPTALQAQDVLITLEIAESHMARQQGLGGREMLAPNEGMLFVFKHKGLYSFWMRSMLFPIDIIWLDENFTVVDLVEEVSPETYPTLFSPEREALYVLEINAGKAREFGVENGTALTPVFDN